MARPKAKKAETSAPAPSVSKAEAVRAALAEGLDSLDDIGGLIKSKYGIEISKQMLSSYKAQQKARDARNAGGPAKRGRKSSAASSGESDILTALEALKPLVAAHGPEKLHRLIDVLK